MFALEHDSQADPASLRMRGNLTIYEVSQAHSALLAVLQQHPERHWQLDMTEIDEVDSAGAQLLLAVQRHLGEQQGRLQVLNPNAALLELLELLQLQVLYPDVLPAQG
ncbi:MAG: STAS domain-containing protein [Pseudomonas sp.]|uniref:STAS domain-containing protein n=1 Tax=Pseudomonas sp. TaxID=306 RepID=UPI0033974AEB